MTPEQIETERQAFEVVFPTAHNFAPHSLSLARNEVGCKPDEYLYSTAQIAWQCWLARAEQEQKAP